MAEATARPGPSLPSIFPGSWIDSNFYIWIGHRDDHRAWSQLVDARRALEASAGRVAPEARALAQEELLVAEGSDWFWWYGDDHSSDHDEAFDDLFRRHLRNAYRLLHQPVPEELFVSNITTAGPAEEVDPPIGWIRPTLDGRNTSYFEWLAAGRFDVRRTAGAMHQIDAAPPVVASIRFGFTRGGELCVRLDGPTPMAQQLAAGHEFTLAILEPESLLITARSNGSDNGCYVNYNGAKAVAGVSLELSVPLRRLGLSPGAVVSFAIAVTRRPSVAGQSPIAVERHPAGRPIEARIPGPDFDAAHWRA